VPVLTKLLEDPARTVREMALGVLGGMGAEAKAAVPAMVALLARDSAREAAAIGLGEIGPAARDAIPALIEVLENQQERDVSYRKWVVRALGRVSRGDQRVVPLLFKSLEAESGEAYQAAFELNELGQEARAAVPALIRTLKHNDLTVRIIAAEAVWTLDPGNKDALATLLHLLKDLSEEVRAAAAEALGKLGPSAEAAVQMLKDALQDKDRSVRERAKEALSMIQGMP
jgi:HEAT repeat protein